MFDILLNKSISEFSEGFDFNTTETFFHHLCSLWKKVLKAILSISSEHSGINQYEQYKLCMLTRLADPWLQLAST